MFNSPYPAWITLARRELQTAERSRLEGNEGRARVCARRAAGIITTEYLRRRGMTPPAPGAYNLLRYLHSLPDVSPAVRETAEHFLARITPDHTLPVDADLVAEARWLAQELLQESL